MTMSSRGHVRSAGSADAALGLLARRKLRGYVRAVRRRLSTPMGALFGVLGVLFIGLWIASIALPRALALGPAPGPELGADVVRGALGLMTVMVVLGSLGHRGLYLPADEIERLLSAPVSRRALVRYRLVVGLGRSFVFGLIMAALTAPRMPSAPFAFAGTFLAMLTLPVLGQAAAILFGDAENRLGRLVRRVPVRVARLGVGLALAALALLVFGGESLLPEADGPAGAPWLAVIEHPLYRWATVPFVPWARAIAADSFAAFTPWFGSCLVVAVALFEGTARLPVDFRELSLETSADVARRLARLRSGRGWLGGASSGRTLGWRVPWLFGRGPFGAVAWLKTCAIVRKARGTVFFSAFVLAVLTLVTTTGVLGNDGDPLVGAALIAVLGTMYLASGLRFDFRADLDLMETIKAWPLSPVRVFLASILPVVSLVTLLIVLAIGLRSLVLGAFPPGQWVVLALVPVAALLWVALDNALFLLAPVRYVPGQGSAVQHTGRTMILVVLRVASLALIGVASAGTFALVGFGGDLLEAPRAVRLGASVLAAGLVVGLCITALVRLGGWALHRFDVARERAGTI